MNTVYILYGENYDNFRYYISNTNPIVWNTDVNYAKRYLSSKSAEYEILADYNNYRDIKKQIENGSINKIYVAEYDTINGTEIRRLDIL